MGPRDPTESPTRAVEPATPVRYSGRSEAPMQVVTMSCPVGGVLFPGPLRGSGSVTLHLCGPPEGPSGEGRTSSPALDSALLLAGVAEPAGSLRPLVRSYRTVSPSPVPGEPGHRRSVSLWPDPRGRPRLARTSTIALWSPDLPQHPTAGADRAPRSPGQLIVAPSVPHGRPNREAGNAGEPGPRCARRADGGLRRAPWWWWCSARRRRSRRGPPGGTAARRGPGPRRRCRGRRRDGPRPRRTR